jgi:hypothetical protein
LKGRSGLPLYPLSCVKWHTRSFFEVIPALNLRESGGHGSRQSCALYVKWRNDLDWSRSVLDSRCYERHPVSIKVDVQGHCVCCRRLY